MKPPFDVKAEMSVSRTFDAPRALVYEAWVNPEHMKRWLGPKGFTTPVCEIDLRVGGAFLFEMEAPDGKRYPFRGTYDEIVPNERLVFTGLVEHDPPLAAFTTVTFSEQDGKTTVQVHQVYSGVSDSTRGAKQGWSESVDRLGELVTRRRT